jgi:hypothetical protein
MPDAGRSRAAAASGYAPLKSCNRNPATRRHLMFRTKVGFADWQTPEQHAITVRLARRDDDARRTHCNMLKFWRVCTKPICRRNHSCSGDMHACFRRHWALVPEDFKEWVRGAIMAKLKGAKNVDELARAAEARRADYFKRQEKLSGLFTPAQPAGGEDAVPPAGARIGPV